MRYQNYTGPWPWPNFTPKEIACKHCGELWQGDTENMPDWFQESMDNLQKLRDDWDAPLTINSGHRCPVHNVVVGGSKSSQHKRVAFDVRCPTEKQHQFCQQAQQAGFTGIGRYPNSGFVHVDRGPKREWTL